MSEVEVCVLDGSKLYPVGSAYEGSDDEYGASTFRLTEEASSSEGTGAGASGRTVDCAKAGAVRHKQSRARLKRKRTILRLLV